MANTRRRRAHRLALGVAAVGVVTTVTGVAATQPGSISASLVDLTALIVVGSSTNPSGAGVEDFFEGKFNDPLYTGPDGDDIVYVNFLSGPAGIERALAANPDEPNAILASGWGAANASLLLLQENPEFSQTVVVLDNDVARPDGGFGTRYPWFALIGVNPIPTPSQTDALAVVNIGYEYDYNSNAPADLLNPVAAVNSLVAYLYRHRNQAELDLPVNADGTPEVTCDANTCAITVSGDVLACPDARCSAPPADRISAYVTTRDNTTYVTYTSDGLPLANLIRDVVPFGDQIADATEPLLKLIVDSAYYGGNPIPRDPSAYRPARLFPPPTELLATAVKVPGAIEEGLDALTSSTSTESTTSSEPPPTAATRSTTPSATADPPDAETVEAAEQKADGTADLPVDTGKPLTSVVRDSARAEPGKVGLDDETKPVSAEDDSPAVEVTTAPTSDDTAEHAAEADDGEQDGGDEGAQS